nr:MAG TPA: hypothetical protein [Caudoviricetes sp.]
MPPQVLDAGGGMMERLTFDGSFCDIVMVFHALKEEG